jgi:UV DNA damage repair endonuclease
MEDLPDYVDILAASRMEWEILQLLLLSNDDKSIWTTEEVLDETADPVVALDARGVICDVWLPRPDAPRASLLRLAATPDDPPSGRVSVRR